jgi:hypothetical protein
VGPVGNADTPRPATLWAGAPAKSSEQVMPTHKAGRQGTEVEVIACARAFHSPPSSYTLPAKTPAALQPSGARLLLDEAEVYDPPPRTVTSRLPGTV